jgi:poly(beta-D-mannuronate) lyase
MNIYRGGNDESTLGPKLIFQKNKLTAVNSGETPLISLTGVQVSNLRSNSFTNCNPTGLLMKYSDRVRARHRFSANQMKNAGRVEKDQFVMEE